MQREMINTIKISFAILTMWGPALPQQSAQPTFQSAALATQTLFEAVQRHDEQAIAKILGGPTELTTSPDKGQDKLDRELFVKKYEEMHRLGRENNGSMTLYIGAENWPFPVPLVKKNGAWQYDAEAGLKEVTVRRIGENEFSAIAICQQFAAAGKRYQAKPGTANLADISPASLVARVTGEPTSGDPILFQGYYFHVMATRRALIAYPAEYRSSGVMTFIVTAKDVVYEKDLGSDTATVARAMTAFHKDATWRATDE
jgi:hypothetical protein